MNRVTPQGEALPDARRPSSGKARACIAISRAWGGKDIKDFGTVRPRAEPVLDLAGRAPEITLSNRNFDTVLNADAAAFQ